MDILTGILIPFVGTTAGSACVFFLRGELKPGVQKAFLGFASGVMVAASVWSLLIPAMEMSEGDVYKRQMYREIFLLLLISLLQALWYPALRS